MPNKTTTEIAAWRATFRRPKLRANQLQIECAAPVPVEVYRKSRRKWDAREPRSGNSYHLDGIDSAEAAKAHIEGLYCECVEPWRPFDQFGNEVIQNA
ncbi:MAG: hypothetical protein KGL39_39610 [Patescibacteria group bacterium]|nr:hypothetical protein [Patescibacteria group bacterium]